MVGSSRSFGKVVPAVALAVLGALACLADAEAGTSTSPGTGPRTGASALRAPVPHPVASRAIPRAVARTALVGHANAPFPFDGRVPGSDRPFVETSSEGVRGHRTGSGRLYREDTTFADNRVLLHIPPGFDIRRPAFLVVYLHGHGADLETDVAVRQRLPDQITESGANALLVAPQFAVKAPNSSIGKLWQAGGTARLLDEAARNFATMYGDPRAAAAFARLPVVIVAYSGGYVAAAWSADHGGLGRRLIGMVLLDAVYGETDRFARWLADNRTGFLVSAYSGSTRRRNEGLRVTLADNQFEPVTSLPARLGPGTVAFLDAGDQASHRDFVTDAWTASPVADVLRRLPTYRRPAPPALTANTSPTLLRAPVQVRGPTLAAGR